MRERMIGMSNIFTKSWKSVGFYVGLVACISAIVNLVAYNYVPFDIYMLDATFWTLGGVVLFLVFSCFRITSELAPVSLMVSSFMSLLAFVQTPGTIDYFTTQFFDGFSMSTLFALPTPVWASILTFVASFALASVAMYLPFAKRR